MLVYMNPELARRLYICFLFYEYEDYELIKIFKPKVASLKQCKAIPKRNTVKVDLKK